MSKKQISIYISVVLLFCIILYFSRTRLIEETGQNGNGNENGIEGFMNMKAMYHSQTRNIRNIIANVKRRLMNLFHTVSKKIGL